jgi:hypothetical protein
MDIGYTYLIHPKQFKIGNRLIGSKYEGSINTEAHLMVFMVYVPTCTCGRIHAP